MVTLYLASPSSAGSYVARFGESLELGEVGAAIGGESERAHGYDAERVEKWINRDADPHKVMLSWCFGRNLIEVYRSMSLIF